MKTHTIEKGLEAHITQHLCLVNGFEESRFEQNICSKQPDWIIIL